MPRTIPPMYIERMPAENVRAGYLLHDGLVLDIDTEYSPRTGQPLRFIFDTPQADIDAEPGEMVIVYGKVTEETLAQAKAAHDAARERPVRV